MFTELTKHTGTQRFALSDDVGVLHVVRRNAYSSFKLLNFLLGCRDCHLGCLLRVCRNSIAGDYVPEILHLTVEE